MPKRWPWVSSFQDRRVRFLEKTPFPPKQIMGKLKNLERVVDRLHNSPFPLARSRFLSQRKLATCDVMRRIRNAATFRTAAHLLSHIPPCTPNRTMTALATQKRKQTSHASPDLEAHALVHLPHVKAQPRTVQCVMTTTYAFYHQ